MPKASMKTSAGIPLPPVPAGSPGRPPNERYRQQYGVIVVFPDEAAQRAGYDALRGMGHRVKVVVT